MKLLGVVSASLVALGMVLSQGSQAGHLAVDRQFETLALADRAEAGEAQPGESANNRLPLRVQNLGLGHDVNNDPGHPATPVRELG